MICRISPLSDRIGRKTTYFLFFTLGFVCYASAPTLATLGMLGLFAAAFCLIASMYGGGFATIPAYLADIFGTQFVGAIHGRLLTAWSTAGIVGPVIVNYMHDSRKAAGIAPDQIYHPIFYVLAGLLVAGFICNLLIRPLAKKWFMKPEEVEALQTKTARDRAMHAVEIREREDTRPGIGLLQPIGLLLIAVAIVWWITFYTKVGGIGGAWECLLYSAGPCLDTTAIECPRFATYIVLSTKYTTTADAPVRYPFLWDAPKQNKTQWPGFAPNGSDIFGLTRNTGEVIGVFGTFHPKISLTHLFFRDFLKGSSLNFDGLLKLEDLVKQLEPPRTVWVMLPAGKITEEAIAAHVIYAAEQRHAVEVPASDKDHLQTWLSNRVGLKLVAPDLVAEGFQLVGGRLLPAGQGKAAMLLYEDANGQRISLFVTADSSAKSKGTYMADADGPEAIYWLDKGYACAVVGSLPREQLAAVAKRAYGQLLAGIAS